MLKIFSTTPLFVLIILFFSFTTYAQVDQSLTEKRKIYEELVQSIQDQEAKAQYSGDDPIIRDRLKLPPKPTSFEEWVSQSKSIDSKNSKNIEGILKNESDSKSLEQISKPQEQISKPQEQMQLVIGNEVEIQYPLTKNETYAAGAVFLSLLLMNFLLYATTPSIRKLTIAPPFDLGVRGSKSDAENIVKVKRYLIEILLLSIGIFIYVSVISRKNFKSENIIQVLQDSALLFFIIYILYLSARFAFGFSTKCPKCKTPFASSKLNEYNEPKATYQKHYGNGKSCTFETGVTHRDYICKVCSHEWKKNQQYQKQLTY